MQFNIDLPTNLPPGSCKITKGHFEADNPAKIFRAEIMPAQEAGTFILNFCIVISYQTIGTRGETGLDIVKNSDYQ